MLIDVLEKSIVDMQEIHELEKSSNDVQKQEKNDKIYVAAVDDTFYVVKSVSQSMTQLQFAVSNETRSKMISLIKTCDDAIAKGMVQETTANYIQKEVNGIKKVILQEWLEYYHRIADPKVNMLQTVKGIAPEKEKVDYASNKIKQGATWEFKQENLDRMATGLQEAEVILTNLGLTEEVTEFLKKVSAGRANVSDLSTNILSWLADKNMSSKLTVSFR